MTGPPRVGVLFVCMGNICRSPLAEGIFLHEANRRRVVDRFRVDSAGTGAWHVGERPDPRMQAVADAHGVHLPSRARQVRRADFTGFDLLVCMDEDNRESLLASGAPPGKLSLLLEYDEAASIVEVPDPYYGGPDGFHTVYRLVESACRALIDHLLAAPADPR